MGARKRGQVHLRTASAGKWTCFLYSPSCQDFVIGEHVLRNRRVNIHPGRHDRLSRVGRSRGPRQNQARKRGHVQHCSALGLLGE